MILALILPNLRHTMTMESKLSSRDCNTNQREFLPVASRSIDPTGIASAVQKCGDKMENGCDIKRINEDICLPF